jgi:4-amino-4-deoxy-L-arabinose transferase-like glycosyltransferase
MLKPAFMIIGIVWVLLFFLLSTHFSKKWLGFEEKKYVRKLFLTALVLRLIWVVFSYFFYTIKTGIPFEFGSSDALAYHDAAVWYREIGWSATIDFLFAQSYSDAGYPIYLTALYSIIGPNIFVTRVVKAFLSAWTCVLIYKLAKRNLGEEAGRMAGIFCALSPNLVIYCGMHLKETEMIFLAIASLERADSLLRQRKINIWNIVLTVLLIVSLFFFRTVLGASVVFAFFTALVFSSTSVMTKWNRTILVLWAVIAIAVMAGGTIANEVEGYWNSRGTNQSLKRQQQVNKGVKWAKYATGTVMAPMMFVMPFPTMVDVDEQYNQQLVNSGNYVRNFMGIFVIMAVFNALFIKRNWRDFSLIGSFVVAYLGIICSSGFANSERFLLPGLPILLMMAAYGITIVDARTYKYVRMWYILLPIMVVGWAIFKLGSRGIL